MRRFALAGLLLAAPLSVTAQPYGPRECRSLERLVSDLIRAESSRQTALQQLYDAILPFGRPPSGRAGLDAAHIATTTEFFAAIQQHQRFVQGLEDYQHQLRLCARG